MNIKPVMSHARRGFTLIELLVVIAIILGISSMFLSLPSGNGGGLVGAQRMLASSFRSLRAIALLNRGSAANSITYNSRYRLLILNDPADQVNHLRKFVLAVGSVDSMNVSSGIDPSTITSTTDSNYKWSAPNPPMVLPRGIYFIPPANNVTTSVTLPADQSGKVTPLIGRRSIIGPVADLTSTSMPDNQTSPPRMKFAAVNQPSSLKSSPHSTDGKEWYYVELQNTGSSNHFGKVILVLANASLRPDGLDKAVLDAVSESQFAALILRPNGDVSMTSDADDMNAKSLKK